MSEVALVPGYAFVDKGEIELGEVLELREAAQWDVFSEEHCERALKRSAWAVGVRDNEGKLVGFGSLDDDITVADRHYGDLGFSLVRPEHRRRGIGMAILQRRIEIADEAGITHLEAVVRTDSLMCHVFPRLGFMPIGEGTNHIQYERQKANLQ